MSNKFYGLVSEDFSIIEMEGEYSSTALHNYEHAAKDAGVEPKDLILIFSEFEYTRILSSVEAELTDADGDGLIPVYVGVAFSTQLPVFPHASVDTEEEAAEFKANFPDELAGPFKIELTKAWPRPVEVLAEQTPSAA
ncbi:hypothetical protein LUCX_264 [Xanthomonas phage vB_XciM_LucasX]|nr:hypothetical protein LUCX_264 [Xanthomonas phage vB_XciM_LucasX]